MSLLSNLTTTGLEEQKDVTGSGFSPLPSNIYNGTVKLCYLQKSAGGALGAVMHFDLDGREYRETLWLTNTKGENFYVGKKDNKKYPLAGFTLFNNICLITTGKEASQLTPENKVIKVYDYEAKGEVPKEFPVLTAILGKPVSLAIRLIKENKMKKNGNEYVATDEIRESNAIHSVFDTASQKTVLEAMHKSEPLFWGEWLKENKDKVIDRTKPGSGKASGGSDDASATKGLFD